MRRVLCSFLLVAACSRQGDRVPAWCTSQESLAGVRRLEARTLEVLESARATFPDGTPIWNAGAAYESVFLFDFAQAVFGSADYFGPADVLGVTRRFVLQPDANGQTPMALWDDGTVQTYYAGSDYAYHHATGEATWVAPLLYRWAYERDHDLSAFRQDAHLLERALLAIPMNPETHLVTVTPGDEWVPWGYQETARFTGDVTMGSVMMWRACLAMAELYGAAGDQAEARSFARRVASIAASLGPSSPLWDAEAGMFYAATGTNRQIDVLASALAVSSGLADATQARAIGLYLASHHDELSSMGYYRQSDRDWAVTGFIRAAGPYTDSFCSGCYQNGYWSVGTGWILEAMASAAPLVADAFLADLLATPDPSIEYHAAASVGGSGSARMIAASGSALEYIHAHCGSGP